MTWFGTSTITSFTCVTAPCRPTSGCCQTASRALPAQKPNPGTNALSPLALVLPDGLVFRRRGGNLFGCFSHRLFLWAHVVYRYYHTLSAR